MYAIKRLPARAGSTHLPPLHPGSIPLSLNISLDIFVMMVPSVIFDVTMGLATLFEIDVDHIPTPLGMKFIPMTDHPANHVTIMDAGFAIQKLTEQDLLIESDKLINQQWERTFLTVVTDFAVIYEKARVVLNSDWS